MYCNVTNVYCVECREDTWDMPDDWMVGMVREDGRATIPSSARNGLSSNAALPYF